MAVALPALVVVLVGALAVLTAVDTQLRCVDAAGAGARAAARGDSDEAVRAAVLARADGARVQLARSDGEVRISVALPVGPAASSPMTVSAVAVAADESDPGPGAPAAALR